MPAHRRSALRRFAPLAGLALAAGVFFALGLHRSISLEALRQNHEALRAFVAAHAVASALIYVGLYTLATAASVPGGLVLTVTGGLLFGTVTGTLLTLVGATAGATAVFLAARSALGDVLRHRLGGALARMAEGFRQDAFSYLLVLRLIPLFPFFVVNLAPAFLGVKLSTYVLATALGIIPGTFVYASVGAGLGSVLAQGGDVSLSGALTPQVIVALIGLAVLSLVPVLYRRLRPARGAA
jgi:uncharacterized membrane protein YdjX (TVP38/TMEM64 family)